MLKNALAGFTLTALALLPLRWVQPFAGLIARCMREFKTTLRHVTATNIELTHPTLNEQEKAQLVQQSMISTIATALEMPAVWHHNNAWLNKKITAVYGEEHLRDELHTGRGVLVICPHVGNWEVFGRFLPRYGETTSLYQPPKYRSLEAIVKKGREQSGARLVPTNQRGIAQLLKALKQGQIVGILPDQRPKNDSGAFAPFMGVQALTMTLVYKLLQRTGCKIILGYALRDANGFSIHFKEALVEIYSKEQAVSLAAMNQMVAMSTQEDIAQYQWGYKRFKQLPDGTYPYRAS